MRQPRTDQGPRADDGATARQFDALAAIVLTGTYKEAAILLGVTEATIKRHMGDIHRRTDLTTVQLVYAFRAELALYFELRGLAARLPGTPRIGR